MSSLPITITSDNINKALEIFGKGIDRLPKKQVAEVLEYSLLAAVSAYGIKKAADVINTAIKSGKAVHWSSVKIDPDGTQHINNLDLGGEPQEQTSVTSPKDSIVDAEFIEVPCPAAA